MLENQVWIRTLHHLFQNIMDSAFYLWIKHTFHFCHLLLWMCFANHNKPFQQTSIRMGFGKEGWHIVSKSAIADAKRFFRGDAWCGHEHLVRAYIQEMKGAKAAEEERIREARHQYYRGILNAWHTYTKDNETVKQAERDLNKKWSQAYTLGEIWDAYETFGKVVAETWAAFKEDIHKTWLPPGARRISGRDIKRLFK